jgi:DNA topoisomerase III
LQVSFSRFQTLHFRDRFKGLDSKLLSYGPCQTPTLGFVVQRHIEIQNHVPEKYYEISLLLSLNNNAGDKNSNNDVVNDEEDDDKDDEFKMAGEGVNVLDNGDGSSSSGRSNIKRNHNEIQLKWVRGRCFDTNASSLFFSRCLESFSVNIVDIEVSEYKVKKPLPLNTVEMLKKASKVTMI